MSPTPTLDATVEEHVDAARRAAACIHEAVDTAETLRGAFEGIQDQDGWERYKEAKCLLQRAEQLMQEAMQAYQELSSHRNDLAKERARPLMEFAKCTANSAYQQANNDINSLSDLVDEAKENYLKVVDAL